MAVTVKLMPTEDLKKLLGIENRGPVHAYFTSECAKEMDPFVPFDEGFLAGTVIQNGQPTSNVDVDTITYDQEYASYQYYGQRRDGTHQVKNYTTAGTGPYWDKRMWSVDKDKVIKEMQVFINKYGGN